MRDSFGTSMDGQVKAILSSRALARETLEAKKVVTMACPSLPFD